MICTMDKLKTPLPSAEEGEVGSKREDKTCLKDGEPERNSEEEEEAEEKTPQAAGQIEDSFHSKNADIPVMETVRFNLNNEVVKMRKEVKRVRTLIIRKLTRRIGALKKKKGKDTDIERNHRRAMRLLEEIQAMKVLPPDVVTKTALQKNLNLNQVCKNPKSTISDRGLTRIASHPQFIKKIDGIKAALKAFKEGHIQGEGQEAKVKGANKTEKFPPAKERQRTKKKKQEIRKGEITELDTLDSPLKDPKAAAVENPKLGRMKVDHLANTAEDINKEVPEKKTIISVVKDKDTNNVPSPIEKKKPNCNTVSKVLQKKTEEEEEESDVELFDNEEKEYFDDSTEERFHRQSSESEESNDDDDFFVGKVSKLKKKIKQNNEGGKREVKVTPSKQEQSELPVAEYKPKAKTAQLQTVFCPTLSVSGRDKGFRRGRGQPGHRETLKGVSQSAFQKQGRGTGYSRSERGGSHQESQLMGSKAWAQGRRDPSRGGANQNHQAKMHPALHPSWEASKKRKEQQGQILAFQGKKIKFDDDD